MPPPGKRGAVWLPGAWYASGPGTSGCRSAATASLAGRASDTRGTDGSRSWAPQYHACAVRATCAFVSPDLPLFHVKLWQDALPVLQIARAVFKIQSERV